jgi:hypothetical protein
MKMFIVLVLLLFSSCLVRTGSGVFSGKIIDISKQGLIFKSCEVDVQYGDQSSKIERFSTHDLTVCDIVKAGEKSGSTYYTIESVVDSGKLVDLVEEVSAEIVETEETEEAIA